MKSDGLMCSSAAERLQGLMFGSQLLKSVALISSVEKNHTLWTNIKTNMEISRRIMGVGSFPAFTCRLTTEPQMSEQHLHATHCHIMIM